MFGRMNMFLFTIVIRPGKKVFCCTLAKFNRIIRCEKEHHRISEGKGMFYCICLRCTTFYFELLILFLVCHSWNESWPRSTNMLVSKCKHSAHVFPAFTCNIQNWQVRFRGRIRHRLQEIFYWQVNFELFFGQLIQKKKYDDVALCEVHI